MALTQSERFALRKMRSLFRDALWSKPAEADLEQAGVPVQFRGTVLRELEAVHQQWASGDRTGAQQRADSSAVLVGEQLADDLEGPSDPLAGETDPRKLAEGLRTF